MKTSFSLPNASTWPKGLVSHRLLVLAGVPASAASRGASGDSSATSASIPNTRRQNFVPGLDRRRGEDATVFASSHPRIPTEAGLPQCWAGMCRAGLELNSLLFMNVLLVWWVGRLGGGFTSLTPVLYSCGALADNIRRVYTELPNMYSLRCLPRAIGAGCQDTRRSLA